MFFVIALCRGLPERIGINEVMNMIAGSEGVEWVCFGGDHVMFKKN